MYRGWWFACMRYWPVFRVSMQVAWKALPAQSIFSGPVVYLIMIVIMIMIMIMMMIMIIMMSKRYQYYC